MRPVRTWPWDPRSPAAAKSTGENHDSESSSADVHSISSISGGKSRQRKSSRQRKRQNAQQGGRRESENAERWRSAVVVALFSGVESEIEGFGGGGEDAAGSSFAFFGSCVAGVAKGSVEVLGRVLCAGSGDSDAGAVVREEFVSSSSSVGDVAVDRVPPAVSPAEKRGVLLPPSSCSALFSPVSHAALRVSVAGGEPQRIEGEGYREEGNFEQDGFRVDADLWAFALSVAAGEASDAAAVLVLLPLSPDFPAGQGRFDTGLSQLPKARRAVLEADAQLFGSLPGFQPAVSADALSCFAGVTTIPQPWREHLPVAIGADVFRQRPVVIVTGRVNVGKSTAVRYLVNTLLNTYRKVRLLDTDLGQSEMYVPGVVSLHEIGAGCAVPNLLGPPFTHVDTEPLTAVFVGATTPKHDVQCALSAIQEVARSWEALPDEASAVPLVINTHGWVSGAGLDVVCEAIRCLRPTLVLQLQQGPGGDTVAQNAWREIQACACEGSAAQPPLMLVLPSATAAQQVRLPPGEKGLYSPEAGPAMRSLQLSCYFMWGAAHATLLRCGKPEDAVSADKRRRVKATDSSETVYEARAARTTDVADWLISQPCASIPFADVAVALLPPLAETVPSSQALRVLNGSLVGLCCEQHHEGGTAPGPSQSSPKSDQRLRVLHDPDCVWRCLGLGVVRAVDPQTHSLYVTLPSALQRRELGVLSRECSALVRGQLELPAAFWESSEAMAPPHVPYFTTGVLRAEDTLGGGASAAAAFPAVRRASGKN
jgi:mRNA cleavage and polyadenylation factor CLP1 P-loop